MSAISKTANGRKTAKAPPAKPAKRAKADKAAPAPKPAQAKAKATPAPKPAQARRGTAGRASAAPVKQTTATKPAAPAPAVAPAPKAPRNLDKPATAEGRPVRAGTKNASMIAALLRGSTLDEMAAYPNTYPRDALTARLWNLWKTSGVGYTVLGGVYRIALPGNLTAATAIKPAAAAQAPKIT